MIFFEFIKKDFTITDNQDDNFYFFLFLAICLSEFDKDTKKYKHAKTQK